MLENCNQFKSMRLPGGQRTERGGETDGEREKLGFRRGRKAGPPSEKGAHRVLEGEVRCGEVRCTTSTAGATAGGRSALVGTVCTVASNAGGDLDVWTAA